MMNRILMLCLLLSFQATAQKTSLSQSVNQAKTQGKVLSAKTRNGQHVVKVLTPSGKIKTIKNNASNESLGRDKQALESSQSRRSTKSNFKQQSNERSKSKLNKGHQAKKNQSFNKKRNTGFNKSRRSPKAANRSRDVMASPQGRKQGKRERR